jgi:predicted anti-sigma-YlaC factor YlaD
MGEKVRCEAREQMSVSMSLALDGQLDRDRRSELEQHVATCPDCQSEWKAMQQVSTMLAESPMVGPSFGFSLRVERRLVQRTTKRRQLFRGVALLTSSLSLAGVGAALVLVIGFGLAAWLWFGSQPVWQQASLSVPQVASGLGLVGKGASLFLKDLLERYGLPVMLLLGTGLAVTGALWAWLLSRKSDRSHRNGYA